MQLVNVIGTFFIRYFIFWVATYAQLCLSVVLASFMFYNVFIVNAIIIENMGQAKRVTGDNLSVWYVYHQGLLLNQLHMCMMTTI